MRVTLFSILLALCVAVLPISAQALIQHYYLNIPRQSLDIALKDFAHQTGLQIALFSDTIDGSALVGPVSGELSAEQALRSLLAPSGLSFKMVNDRTIAIVKAGSTTSKPSDSRTLSTSGDEATEPDGSKSGEAKQSFWSRFRLAQATTGGTSPVGASSDEAPKKQRESSQQKLEEVIVTAQKREERLIDVPISIVALSADELAKRNITRMDDLSLAVPGLAIQSSGSFQRQIILRGVSNIFGTAPLIGLYLDEASVTSEAGEQLDLQTYDLERIEVLRGPQGTLYGEGAAGGTIRFITRNPQLNEFAMDADVATLFTQYGAPSQRIQAVANVPLIRNELGLRVAGVFDHEGGWMDQPAADRKNFNDQNLTDVRVKGLWQPVPQLSVIATAVIHRNDAPPNTGEDANGNFTQVFNFTTTPRGEDNFGIYNLTLTYDLPSVRVLSASSYIKQDKTFENLGFRYQLNGPASETTPYNQYILTRPFHATTFNQELRLTSVGSGPWLWTVGGFYRHAGDEEVVTEIFDLPGPNGAPPSSPFVSQTSILSKSWAVFGDTSYQLTDHLILGTGLRYFHDDEKNRLIVQTATFHALNPRAYAQCKLTDKFNIYASAAKGFRSGGVNNVGEPVYSPEGVWTYELGTKMSLADGHVSADGAVFYSNYTNYQIPHFVPAIADVIISNAGDATIKGIEWALAWRPVDQWSLSVSGDYLKTEFTKIDIDPSSSAYAVGDPLDLFPKYEYTLSAQRDFKWSGRSGFARLDYNEHGRSTYRARNIGPWYYNESDVIHMLNFNMNLQWTESLSLGLFAQNLLNDRGFIDPYSNEYNAARSRPRTFGIQFGVKFD